MRRKWAEERLPALLGFLVGVAFWPTFYGAGTTPRWAVIAVLPCILILTLWPYRLTYIHLAGIAFIGWSLFTLLWTANLHDGTGAAFKLIFLCVVFVYGARLSSLYPVFVGMAAALCISSGLAISEWAGGPQFPEWIPRATKYPGLFINRNTMGEISALVLVAMVSYRSIWALPLIPAVLLSESRTAIMALAIAAAFWLWKQSRHTAIILSLIAIAMLAASLWSGYRILSVEERLWFWWNMLPEITPFGRGLGSFFTLYPFLTTVADTFVMRPEHAHNDILEIAFEAGLVGVGLAIAFVALAIRRAHAANAQIVLIAFLAETLTAFPSHTPATAFVAALCLGYLTRGRVALCERFPLRGMELFAGQTSGQRRGTGSVLSRGGLGIPVRSSVPQGISAEIGRHRPHYKLRAMEDRGAPRADTRYRH